MGFNIMDLMNGATRAAVEGVDNYEAITLTVVKQTSAMTVRHTRRLPPLSVLMIAWKRAWRIITI